MSTHNIQFHDKQTSIPICFLELSEEFRRDSNDSNHPKKMNYRCPSLRGFTVVVLCMLYIFLNVIL